MSKEQKLRAKVITVSDGVVAGTRVDTSGLELQNFLGIHGFDLDGTFVVPDGVESVSRILVAESKGFAGLIVTTGGTGFAPRDQTPEGTLAVIERSAPGLAEAMRAVNPLGRLSRGVAGVLGRTLIINTPGSPKGCVEQLSAVIDVIPHALALIAETPTEH